MAQAEEVFVEDERTAPVDTTAAMDDALVLHLSSYEGPIDVLLQLARDQKVDLAQISILQLARQYIAFIDRAQELSLDVAAEYLVMAAWLAYLKSRLLLPREKEAEGDEPSAEMMAEALSFQLKRLEGIQSGAQKMARRMREYLNVYGRGYKETFKAPEPDKYTVDLYQLLKAYGDITQRKTSTQYKPISFPVMSMEEALERMTRMLGRLPKTGTTSVWTTLNSFLPENVQDPLLNRSSIASLFTASLELAKQGKVELRQEDTYKPIYLRVVEREAYVPENEVKEEQTA